MTPPGPMSNPFAVRAVVTCVGRSGIPLEPAPAVAEGGDMNKAVAAVVVNGPAIQGEFLLLDRRGHILVWNAQ